jgi:AcrR family transcriptional regulator
MIHEMKAARKYRMKRRAESQARTRERIVEAAMSLHEERGVKATTISEIAERAGVERLTVYRHFPDELSLIQACSGHWFELNPVPDSGVWAGIADPLTRTQLALTSLYVYYRRTEAMWSSVLKDESAVPAMKKVMKDAYKYLKALVEDLTRAWNPESHQRETLQAALSHSVQFYTWQSLKNQRLRDAKIAQLMILWCAAVRSLPEV